MSPGNLWSPPHTRRSRGSSGSRAGRLHCCTQAANYILLFLSPVSGKHSLWQMMYYKRRFCAPPVLPPSPSPSALQGTGESQSKEDAAVTMMPNAHKLRSFCSPPWTRELQDICDLTEQERVPRMASIGFLANPVSENRCSKPDVI